MDRDALGLALLADPGDLHRRGRVGDVVDPQAVGAVGEVGIGAAQGDVESVVVVLDQPHLQRVRRVGHVDEAEVTLVLVGRGDETAVAGHVQRRGPADVAERRDDRGRRGVRDVDHGETVVVAGQVGEVPVDRNVIHRPVEVELRDLPRRGRVGHVQDEQAASQVGHERRLTDDGQAGHPVRALETPVDLRPGRSREVDREEAGAIGGDEGGVAVEHDARGDVLKRRRPEDRRQLRLFDTGNHQHPPAAVRPRRCRRRWRRSSGRRPTLRSALHIARSPEARSPGA